MKREIRFRGLRTDGKGFIYGNLEKCENFSGMVYYQIGYGKNYYRVAPESVGQYTGLKDKNGVDIYEGDIIRTQTVSDYNWNDDDISKDKNYFVGMHNGSYCLFNNINDSWPVRQWKDGQNDWYSIENCESFMMEVIGNIHESPELIKH